MSRFGKLLVAALFVVIAGVFAVTMTGEQCTMLSGASELSVDLDQLTPGHARSFCYTDRAGRRIRFLLARGDDGRVYSVFDACRQCYAYHKGYSVSGGDLVCRVCGNRYPIERMTIGKASCVPVGLKHSQGAGVVKIKVADVIAGREFF